jgi:hypothetical protein
MMSPVLLYMSPIFVVVANHYEPIISVHQITDCPLYPPEEGYPKHYSMIDITNNWNTDSTDIPAHHYDSICHFDHQNATQLAQAYRYRDADLPFIVFNIPELDEVVTKWSDIEYLKKLLGSRTFSAEKSKDNHFMYWNKPRGGFKKTSEGKNWIEPTEHVPMQFQTWLDLAVREHNHSLTEREHMYFRLNSLSDSKFLFDELPFFKPEKNLFLVDPDQQRGIHCRFGMRSVAAEAHFDAARNAVVQLGGLRRWIMTHPQECKNMHMLLNGHPSARHTAVDWSKPDLEKFPDFKKLRGHEVILQPGDYLYVPTYWLHAIVSIDVNYQCNTRSGASKIYNQDIKDCGFGKN